MSVGWRGLQQNQQRQQDQEIAHTDIECRITPAYLGDQKTSDIGHNALPDRPTGGHDTNREPLSSVEPKARAGDHRGKKWGKAERADQKVDEIERQQIALPAQCNQPKRNSEGPNVSDLTGTNTIGKTAPDDAADGAPDGQECKSHRDLGQNPSKLQ